MNGIDYKFTQYEVEAMARLINLARNSGDGELIILSTIIATAFNRQVFGQLNT